MNRFRAVVASARAAHQSDDDDTSTTVQTSLPHNAELDALPSSQGGGGTRIPDLRKFDLWENGLKMAQIERDMGKWTGMATKSDDQNDHPSSKLSDSKSTRIPSGRSIK